jgi:DNA repair protein RadC
VDARNSQGHRQRLRERFLSSGIKGFHDYEIIELLLTLGTPRKDCKSAAKEAISQFKSLTAVLEASPATLQSITGIGPKNLFGLKLIKAVADYYLQEKLAASDPINDSQALYRYLRHYLSAKRREAFIGLFLDAKNRIIAKKDLFIGTLTSSCVYPREVVKYALENHAAAAIFAHNHPSGDPEPSAEDYAITKRLLFAFRLMDITLHEHVIIGADRFFSFADQGIIRQYNQHFENSMLVS